MDGIILLPATLTTVLIYVLSEHKIPSGAWKIYGRYIVWGSGSQPPPASPFQSEQLHFYLFDT